MDDLFKGCGVEIKLNNSDEDFLKIMETLTRVGVASRQNKILYQSCHILHKKGRYAIVHFKELFKLDGKTTDFTEEDRGRRNRIAKLLEEWNLCKIVDSKRVEEPLVPMSLVKVLPFREKNEWKLEAKYTIGGRREV